MFNLKHTLHTKYVSILGVTAFMLLLLANVSTGIAAARETASKNVLIVLSGHGLEQGEKQPGYEFSEFSKAYLVFKANGLAVDIASPAGGRVEADKYNPAQPYNSQVLADQAIMHKLHNTLSTQSIKASDYDGIFVVGGKGAMFDLPKDKALQQLIANIYANKGSVAAVCHGPAALVDVKLADGSYLISGKAINAFTNIEEQMFGQKWMPHFEFMLEDKLIERGAKFQSSGMMLSHVAVDGRLITGQNPTSSSQTAEALVRSLGYTPVARQPFQDEVTMSLIARVLENDASALQTLKDNTDDYPLALVGMYGFYHSKSAQTDLQLSHGLSLMDIAHKALNNKALDLQIVKTLQKLGHKVKGKALLENLLQRHPDMASAKALLEQW